MRNPPEKYRIKLHPLLGSDASYGNNGFFVIPHPKVRNYYIQCMISDGEGFEHVSVTLSSPKRIVDRCPTWAEMCFVKELFWKDDETVIQYHPPKSQNVSTHPYCLHLWKPIGVDLPMPNPEMIGYVGDDNQSF